MKPLSQLFDNKLKLCGGLFASLLLISCGSYQNTGYNDGIYSPNPSDSNYSAEKTSQVSNSDVNPNVTKDGNYYKNYFAEQGEKISQAQAYNQDSEIFTDVESYSSRNNQDTTAIAAENRIYNEDPASHFHFCSYLPVNVIAITTIGSVPPTK